MIENLRKITTIYSGKKGPVVVIMGGTHGNEPCGVEVIDYLKQNLKLKKGKVFLIYGNPKAIEQNVRQTEFNLNRIFKDDSELSEKQRGSYEYKRSREIIPYLDESDILIDIHSTAIENSEAFIICEPNSTDLAKYLPMSVCCNGFDCIEQGSTEQYMDKNGKKGVCVECGNHNDKDAFKIGLLSVDVLLSCLGMLDKDFEIKVNGDQKTLKANKMYKTKTDNFKLAKHFENFELIKKGDLIATDGEKKIISEKDQYIVFAHNRDAAGEEGFICLDKIK